MPTYGGTMPEARTRVAEILGQRGWSQGELVRRSGVNRMTVWWAFHGTSEVSLDSWLKLARALEVPLSEIAPDQAAKLAGVVV
jgi:transcriptional regulator with XRE-family HTH domain